MSIMCRPSGARNVLLKWFDHQKKTLGKHTTSDVHEETFFWNVKMVILPSTLPKSAGNQVSFLKSIHLNGQYPTTNCALAWGVIELNQVSGVFGHISHNFLIKPAHNNCLKIITRFPLPPKKKKRRGHSTLPPFLGPLKTTDSWMQRTQQQFAANQVNGWISLHLFEGPTQTAHVSSACAKPPPMSL